jgi:hypothetical protein
MQAALSAALIFGFQCRRHRPPLWFLDSNAGDAVRCFEIDNGEINAGL